MLKEVKVIFSCNVAGYNVNNIDRNELLKWLESQLKAFVGAKDIGIMGNASLIIEGESDGN
jgi:hypothetical protein